MEALIDNVYHKHDLQAWEAIDLDTNIDVKWRVSFQDSDVPGELNFHGGSDNGKNWYVVHEKNEKDLEGRI